MSLTARRLSFLAIIYLMLLIVVLLYPFNFSSPVLHEPLFSFKIGASGKIDLVRNSNKKDVARNLALFLPLGAILFFCIKSRISSQLGRIFIVAIFSFLVSVMCEAFQFFLPTRESAIYDLAANTVGAITGAALVVVFPIFKKAIKDFVRT